MIRGIRMKRGTLSKMLAVCMLAVLPVCMTACGKKVSIEEVLEAAQQYVLEGNYEEAISAFNEAIGIDPKHPDAYNGLYKLYMNNKDYVSAWETIWKGIEAAGIDPENSTAADADTPDSLQGSDLLAYNLKVIKRIMENPVKDARIGKNATLTTNYEYEFDDNGYITYRKVITENNESESRHINNSVGIPETYVLNGPRDYTLTKTDTNYIATYYSSNGVISPGVFGEIFVEKIYDLNGNLIEGKSGPADADGAQSYTMIESWTYDENGNRQAVIRQSPTGIVTSYFENDHLVRNEYPGDEPDEMDWDVFVNYIDEYGRVEHDDITSYDGKTGEPVYSVTMKYYYYDTVDD